MLNHKSVPEDIIKTALVALVLAVLIFAGPPATADPPATSGEGKSELDLSLPNVGLREPADIGWPKGEALTYEYEAELMPVFVGLPGGVGKITLIAENEPRPNGGKMEDKLLMGSSFQGMRMNASMDFSTEYNASHKVIAIEFSVGMKLQGAIPMPMQGKIPETLFSYSGELRDGRFIEDFKGAPMMGVKDSHYERQAPDDGFFFCGGSATPGLTALMLSALDIENGETATVWIINPDMPQTGTGNQEPPGFFRASICRLDKCNENIQQIWSERRESFDNWTPSGDIKTYAVYDDPYKPDDAESIFFAYIDPDGKLTRIEETSKNEPIVVVLKKAQGQEKAWWGKGNS